MVKDLCLYRLWKSNPKLQTKHQHYIMVNYINRLLHQVNIGKIINSSLSFYVFPDNKDHLTLKYSNTIRYKVTNYRETVTNANGNVTCSCKD